MEAANAIIIPKRALAGEEGIAGFLDLANQRLSSDRDKAANQANAERP